LCAAFASISCPALLQEASHRTRERRDHGYRVDLHQRIEHASAGEIGSLLFEETVSSCVVVQNAAPARR
jgi:hypothetical protein